MSIQSFYSQFSVPDRMNVEGVGVDLSEVSLRFVRFDTKKGSLVLRDYGEYAIPEGVISLGRIQKPEILRDILFKLKKERHVKYVHISLPESLSYLVDMEIPIARRSEIRDSIELQLEEHVPISLSEAAFDYDIVDDTKKPGVVSVAVAVAPKDVVSSYVETFAFAGITVLSVETDSNALARAVIKKGNRDTLMLLDLGRVKTGVYIVSNSVVSFVSDIDIGGKDIQAAIVKELNVTPADAKELCRTLHTEEEPSEEAYSAVSSIFSDLQEEINKHFIYWHTHKDSNGMKKDPISRTVLCGSEATLYGLEEYLSAGLKTPIQVANVWENVFSFEKEIPKIRFQDSLLYSTAIGLALYAKKL